MFRTLLKGTLRGIARVLFRVRVNGVLDGLKNNPRTLIIANHDSWLDGLLLGLFLPVNPVFVVYTGILGRPLFRIALKLVDYLTVDTSSPMSIKRVVELLKSGRPVVIFPEGRLSTTGALMKVYSGTAFAAVKADATIVPVRLDGTGISRYTRLGGLHPRQYFPQITLTVMAPTKIDVPADKTARERRRMAGEAMRNMMQNMLFVSARKKTLYGAFLDAARLYGLDRAIMTDAKQLMDATKTMPDYTYQQLLDRTLRLGGLVTKITAPGECVGLLMPNMADTLCLLMATSAKGRVPAMLNYKAGAAGLQDACTAANIKTIVTARLFVAKSGLEQDVAALAERGIRIIYLEDAAQDLSSIAKLQILLASKFPSSFERQADVNSPAVVLFTSGSEGKPKGVVLSHRALTANIEQVRAVFDFSVSDRVLNALPIFHSFGLTGGSLLPLLSGMHLVLYVSPLHYKVIPELSYDRNCTVLFGTSTFLANYGKHADPYDFFQLRYVVAGAEKLADAVRTLWFEKFGKRIFEGYGATETAPVIAVNTPKAYRTGTVGQILPGIEHQLVPVPGIEQGGALYVRGPNVMSGYYLYDEPGVLQPTHSDMGAGWYATGDVVKIEDGFVSIVDRVKRFAKIAGEMVSLSVVERIAEKALSGAHAVSTQPDSNKGEALVLFTTNPDLTRDKLMAVAKAEGHSELAVPRKIITVAALPLLGTGKTDYVSLKKLAMAA